MKNFLKLFKRRLTPVEQLAKYEEKIVLNSKIVESSESNAKQIEDYIDVLQQLLKSDNTYLANLAESRLACYLPNYLKRLSSCHSDIEKASAKVKYYEVLRDNLKKELNL